MPRPISLSTTCLPLKPRVAAEIKKLRRGDCFPVLDWAREWGVSDQALRAHIPRELLAVRHVPGKPRPVSVVLCPLDAKPSPQKPPRS
jgi:hypothetical protein